MIPSSIVVLVFLHGWRPAIIPIVGDPGIAGRYFRCDVRSCFAIKQSNAVSALCSLSVLGRRPIVVVENVERHFRDA